MNAALRRHSTTLGTYRQATGVHQGLPIYYSKVQRQRRVSRAFEYSSEKLSELEKTLSADRLKAYAASVGGNTELAARLYEQNALLAEALYGVLQGLEV